VTNHALLAIDTFDSEVQVLPEYDAVVIDEAHELVSRATGANSGELAPSTVDRVARRVRKHVDEKTQLVFEQAAEAFREVLETAEARRFAQHLPEDVAEALIQVRDAARQVISALARSRERAVGEEGARRQAQAAAEQVFELSDRMLLCAPDDVIWLDRSDRYTSLRIAPLSVARQLRYRLFARTRAVLTSATLKLGGDFDGVARSVGLYPEERADRLPEAPNGAIAEAAVNQASGTAPADPQAGETETAASAQDSDIWVSDSGVSDSRVSDSGVSDSGHSDADASSAPDDPIRWHALDVGSPFDYRRQAILYIARHLEPPGRDGIRPDQLDELAGLIDAAGGRTLGLFSSLRAAQAAAEAIAKRLDFTVVCQGEDSLPQLIARFGESPRTCLFGTLSLWQGVNVPGPSCQLVVIDRIPFPRPDDPLAAARQEAVARHGGNGFMAVAATHAALLLAQGAGRLIRAAGDRGAVAVLDSRLANARYAGYLRASLPPFWPTDDPKLVRAALRRLDAEYS
jgi:ATP-dependent DNA helicase DinG